MCVCVCVCDYEEHEKNQKILVGYSLLAAEISVLTPIPRNSEPRKAWKQTFRLSEFSKFHEFLAGFSQRKWPF